MTTVPPDFAIRAAVEVGARSPCAKSKRGAAVFVPEPYPEILGAGFNMQPEPFTCTADDRCRSACGKLCEHAEQVAIRGAIQRWTDGDGLLRGLQLVHAKVVDGQLVTGGGPSCWQCSRLVLAVGLDGVWLYEQPLCMIRPSQGFSRRSRSTPTAIPVWRYYTAEDFHRVTLAACGIGDRG